MHEDRVILSALVLNNPGVLVRVAGLFARRGFNIDSLTVSETENSEFSRMTISAHGNKATIKQISRQLMKLEDVQRVITIPSSDAVCSELLLVKMSPEGDLSEDIFKVSRTFGARILSAENSNVMLEYTGSTAELDALISELRPLGIRELARTGITALARGDMVLSED